MFLILCRLCNDDMVLLQNERERDIRFAYGSCHIFSQTFSLFFVMLLKTYIYIFSTDFWVGTFIITLVFNNLCFILCEYFCE